MDTLKKITKRSITDEVFMQLKTNIVNGNWKSGDKIPSENALAASLGVSRMSVRVAIQRLSMLGMIEARVGEGTFIKEFSPSAYISELMPMTMEARSQIEILEFRKTVESECIRLAIKRATDEQIAKLSDIFDGMLKHCRTDEETYIKLDYKFHLTIAQLSGNSIFVAIFESFSDLLLEHYNTLVNDTWNRSSTGEQHSTDSHEMIMRGIRERNESIALEGFLQMIANKVRMYAPQKSNAEYLTKGGRYGEGDNLETWINEVLYNR